MKPLGLIFCLLIFVPAKAQTSVLKTADSLYNYGYYAKAITFYKQLENGSEYFEKVAKAYVLLGNYDQAILYYSKALQVNPNNALVKFEQSKLLFQTNQLNQAKGLLIELVETDPFNPNYQFNLGLTYNALGKEDVAQAYFNKVYQLDDTHQKAIYELAKFNLQKRAFIKVEDYVVKGLQSYANNRRLIGLSAQNYYWQAAYHKSINQFLRLLDLGETTSFVYEKLGVCYTKVYNYSKAIKYLKLALATNPKDANIHYLLGLNFESIYEYQLAEEHVLEAIKIKDLPLDEAYRKLGVLYNLQDKRPEAIKAFTHAINENPKVESSYFFKAFTKLMYYTDMEEKSKAVDTFCKQFPNGKYSEILKLKLEELRSDKFQNKTE